MTTSNKDRVALVAGAGGIVGHAVARELSMQGWTVRGLARRPVDGLESILVDLIDRDATAAALENAADTTHLFYAALSQDPDLAVEAERNGRMLGNVLDGLEAAGAPLRRVVSYEGFKIYGIHLGAKVRTPARESDPPHMPPNINLSQQAQLRARGQERLGQCRAAPRRRRGRHFRQSDEHRARCRCLRRVVTRAGSPDAVSGD